jgi:peptide/nickel transport system permease protein
MTPFLRFIVKRLALAVLTLLLVSVVVFAVSDVLPGNVARSILGRGATPDQVAALQHTLGLDRPLPARYWRLVSGYLRGDWGRSPVLQTAVRPLVVNRALNSLILGAFAFVLVVPLSIAAGVVASLYHGRWPDRLISIAGLSFIALPEFVTGVILLIVFAVDLRAFPSTSQVPTANPADWFRQLLLPSIPLVFVLFGYISRMARAGTIDALRANWARTAVLKGLPPGRVIVRHVLRNSLLPTISVVSVQVGYLVGGLVVVETLFNYPGIGLLAYNSVQANDVTVLEAIVLFTAGVYMIANLLADVLFALLDPRVRAAAQ